MTTVLGTTKAGQEIACWVLKCNPEVFNVAESVVEYGEITDWSVSGNYRKDLMEPGHPCLLWVTGSGSSPVQAGFYAAGTLVEGDDGGVLFLGRYSDEVEANDAEPEGAIRTFVHCRMRWLERPILKADLLRANPTFKRSELVAAAQGSNPRILTPAEYEIVQSFDLRPGPVTPEQRLAFAKVHDDDLEFAVLVNLPDGKQVMLIDQGGDVVLGEWFADREAMGETLERSGSWTEAVRHLAELIVPVAREYEVTGDDDSPVLVYTAEGQDYFLYREGEEEWVEYGYDLNGEQVNDGFLYESLADYLEELASGWDEQGAPSADGGP